MEGREREAPGEARQLGNDHRLEACLAIDMVVAWRLFPLTKLGRETPEAAKPVFFEEAEWKALYMDNFHSKKPDPPEIPPTLRAATRRVGKRGGFLGGKGDGEPGTEVPWRGSSRSRMSTEFWETLGKMKRAGSTSPGLKCRR